MRSLATASLLFLSLSAACAAPEGDADGQEASEAQTTVDLSKASIVEKSRFRHAGAVGAEQDGKSVLAYRFNGFGGTKVRITVKPKAGAFAPTVVLAGPIPGDEKKVVLQRSGTARGGVSFETSLEARGAYRLLVGPRAAFAGRAGEAGGFDVDFQCLAGCDLPEVTLADVLRDLKAEGGEANVRAGLEQMVAKVVPDAALRDTITASLLDILAKGTEDGAALPVLPMSMLSAAQGLFEKAPSSSSATPAPARLDVELSKIGEGCRIDRGAEPKDLDPRLPGLAVADTPDLTYDDCALARLEGLAAAFNALSLGDGSVVRDGAAEYRTVRELASALVQQGHAITLDNARYFADFLGLRYKGATVRAPVWIDTGVALPAGGTLRMPAPHAHHNIWIKGPRFDGQLKFYMGVDAGTSFRTQSTIPRGWSGGRVAYTVEAQEDVLSVLDTAGQLRKKWQAAGSTLPKQGYGQLGVCTDSAAVLEYALKKTVTLYPLANPETGASADEIDRILAALPSDTVGAPREDQIRRIGASIPFDRLEDVPFAAFRDGWKSLGH